MNKKLFHFLFLIVTTCVLSGCVKDVKDALDETALSLQCVNLVQEFDQKNDADPDRNCNEIVADINEIERTCNEFLSDSTKESFQVLRTACEGN